MTNQTSVREFGKMMMRLPPGMREKISDAAKASGRSMNAEVIARLEASFESDEEMTTLKDTVGWLEQTIADMQKQIDRMDNDISTIREMAGMHDRNFR